MTSLIQLIKSKTLKYLKDLDISNNKMGDNNAKLFLSALLSADNADYKCPIQAVNLSRNNLGFKSGALILTLLMK